MNFILERAANGIRRRPRPGKLAAGNGRAGSSRW